MLKVTKKGLVSFLKAGTARVTLTSGIIVKTIDFKIVSEVGMSGIVWQNTDLTYFIKGYSSMFNNNITRITTAVGRKQSAFARFDDSAIVSQNWLDIEFTQAVTLAMLRMEILSENRMTPKFKIFGTNNYSDFNNLQNMTFLHSGVPEFTTDGLLIGGPDPLYPEQSAYCIINFTSALQPDAASYKYYRLVFEDADDVLEPSIWFFEIYAN